MKKLTTLILISSILFIWPINVYAANDIFWISDLKMSIRISRNPLTSIYDVVAQYPVDDYGEPYLKITGLSAPAANAFLRNNQIFLEATTEELNRDLRVFTADIDAPENTEGLLKQISDNGLSESDREEFENLMTQSGLPFSDLSIYEHKQTKFLRADINGLYQGNRIYGDIYFTVHNGNAIYVAEVSHNDPISNNEKLIMEKTVDSIVFYSEDPSLATQKEGRSLADNFITGFLSAAIIIIAFRLAKGIALAFNKIKSKSFNK